MEKLIIFVNTDYGKIVVWLVIILILMLIDVITGFWQAIVNGNFVSHAISDGLIKKATILLILLAIVPFTVVLPDTVTIAVIIAVYLIASINELTSILENAKKMGINIGFLDPIFNVLKVKNERKDKNDKN